MKWSVETLNETVDTEIRELPAGLRARLYRLTQTIEAIGLDKMREPHVKHLEGKLWELRVKAAEGIARGLYITVKGKRVIILHVFVKKSQKTPKSALNIAQQRMKETKT